MLFKRSWRVLTAAFSGCSWASCFNRDFRVRSASKRADPPSHAKGNKQPRGKKSVCKHGCFLQTVCYTAFLLSWRCFDKRVWLLNVVIKCLVPPALAPLSTDLSTLNGSGACARGREQHGTARAGHCPPGQRPHPESQQLPAPFSFSRKCLAQQKMRAEAGALTLCFSLGKSRGEKKNKKINSSVISWKSGLRKGCLAILRAIYTSLRDKILWWFIAWRTFWLYLMSSHYIHLLEESQSSLK